MKLRERLDHLMEELARHVENLVLFEVTDSTHALARRIITEMDEESQKLGATLILADRQEKGVGRGDRSWESPAGGLYMSWLRSGIKAETITQLPMLAATAAWDAITRIGVLWFERERASSCVDSADSSSTIAYGVANHPPR